MGTHSDPTASQAMGRISELERRILEVQARLDECVQIVGDCGTVLMRMAQELGPRYADAIEIYYIDRADTWSEVAHEMGVTRMSVWRYRDVAYAWIDEHVLMC